MYNAALSLVKITNSSKDSSKENLNEEFVGMENQLLETEKNIKHQILEQIEGLINCSTQALVPAMCTALGKFKQHYKNWKNKDEQKVESLMLILSEFYEQVECYKALVQNPFIEEKNKLKKDQEFIDKLCNQILEFPPAITEIAKWPLPTKKEMDNVDPSIIEVVRKITNITVEETLLFEELDFFAQKESLNQNYKKALMEAVDKLLSFPTGTIEKINDLPPRTLWIARKLVCKDDAITDDHSPTVINKYLFRAAPFEITVGSRTDILRQAFSFTSIYILSNESLHYLEFVECYKHFILKQNCIAEEKNMLKLKQALVERFGVEIASIIEKQALELISKSPQYFLYLINLLFKSFKQYKEFKLDKKIALQREHSNKVKTVFNECEANISNLQNFYKHFYKEEGRDVNINTHIRNFLQGYKEIKDTEIKKQIETIKLSIQDLLLVVSNFSNINQREIGTLLVKLLSFKKVFDSYIEPALTDSSFKYDILVEGIEITKIFTALVIEKFITQNIMQNTEISADIQNFMHKIIACNLEIRGFLPKKTTLSREDKEGIFITIKKSMDCFIIDLRNKVSDPFPIVEKANVTGRAAIVKHL